VHTATEAATWLTSHVPPRRRPAPQYPAAAAPAITCINRANIPAVAAVATHYTQDEPVAGWLLPDRRRRPAALRACFALLIEQALQHGFVDRLAGDRAVAIWLDRTQPLPAAPGQLRRLQEVCGPDSDAVRLLADMAGHHAPPIPHLHLAVLAAPDSAAAAALLAHRQQRLDRVGVATFAYATNQVQLGALMDAGFQPSEAVRLPAGPPLWPTLRPAAQRPAVGGRPAAA
jgi:hypothetical protein